MKVVYRQPDATVNVSKVSPLKRGGQILAGLLVFLIGLYFILGLFIDVAVMHLPPLLEDKMGDLILEEFIVHTDVEAVAKYEELLTRLIGEEMAMAYDVKLIEESDINAFALPGNTIVLTTGLIEAIEEEEMLAFVLGHELGHFEHRDHLKGYGRLIVLYTLVNIVTDSDSELSLAFLEVLSKAEMKFSQQAELAADLYGAELIKSTYGSYKGGLAFFDLIAVGDERSAWTSYFDTHPHPEKRKAILMTLETPKSP